MVLPRLVKVRGTGYILLALWIAVCYFLVTRWLSLGFDWLMLLMVEFATFLYLWARRFLVRQQSK